MRGAVYIPESKPCVKVVFGHARLPVQKTFIPSLEKRELKLICIIFESVLATIVEKIVRIAVIVWGYCREIH